MSFNFHVKTNIYGASYSLNGIYSLVRDTFHLLNNQNFNNVINLNIDDLRIINGSYVESQNNIFKNQGPGSQNSVGALNSYLQQKRAEQQKRADRQLRNSAYNDTLSFQIGNFFDGA